MELQQRCLTMENISWTIAPSSSSNLIVRPRPVVTHHGILPEKTFRSETSIPFSCNSAGSGLANADVRQRKRIPVLSNSRGRVFRVGIDGVDGNCRGHRFACQRGSSSARASASSPSSVDEFSGPSTSGADDSEVSSGQLLPAVETGTWKWRDYGIRYQRAGEVGPPLMLIHGFGANCDHWRKNIPELAKSHRVYAVDLLGYGYSDKPDPRAYPRNTLYTFEVWAQQVLDFCDEIIKDTAFLICNSVGGIVGLQCAVMQPEKVRGLVVMNVSLRMLHIKKQSWFAKPFVRALQDVLNNTNIGQRFFKNVATPSSVKRILCQCYHDDNAVTDELVEKILGPGLLPGAADVFLDFICYSDGPLPEELLPQVKCPVLIGWGEKDPWETLKLGRPLGNISTVEDFVTFPNVGHCPQDEAPHLVNPFVASFVQKHSS